MKAKATNEILINLERHLGDSSNIVLQRIIELERFTWFAELDTYASNIFIGVAI